MINSVPDSMNAEFTLQCFFDCERTCSDDIRVSTLPKKDVKQLKRRNG